MFEKVKNAFKNVKTKVSVKWHSMTTKDKVKMVVKGMTYFGCGCIASPLWDNEHGKVISACTYVAATGLASAGGYIAGEVMDAAIDAWSDLAAEARNEFKSQEEKE